MRNKGAWKAVEKLATCNHCGDQQVAWVQSASTKWYLATAYINGGQILANKLDPHFKHCPRTGREEFRREEFKRELRRAGEVADV